MKKIFTLAVMSLMGLSYAHAAITEAPLTFSGPEDGVIFLTAEYDTQYELQWYRLLASADANDGVIEAYVENDKEEINIPAQNFDNKPGNNLILDIDLNGLGLTPETEYTLHIPAGFLWIYDEATDDYEGNAEALDYTFIFNGQSEVEEIPEPEYAGIFSALEDDMIRVTWNDEYNYMQIPVDGTEQISIAGGGNTLYVNRSNTVIELGKLEINLSGLALEEGTSYTLTLPAKYVEFVTLSYQHIAWNAEGSTTFTYISENTDEPGEKEPVGGATIIGLENLNTTSTTISITWNNQTLTEGSMADIELNGMYYEPIIANGIITDSVLQINNLDLEIGEYTLVIEQGTVFIDGAPNAAQTLTFTIDNTNSINSINADGNARYFNLQGVETTNPKPGSICIIVKDNKTTKAIVK